MSDLISRQAAIDAIKELCLHYTPTKSVLHPHMDFVIEELTNLPSAQPERKKGNWILIADSYTDYVKCDQCGNISYIERNFCPSCGADMRGEQE